jgi:putative transposase
VWLYHRFPLSFREVEELMLERGTVVSYETVRHWCVKLGPAYARELRRHRPRPGTSGIWTKSSSRSTAGSGTCGGPSTRTGRCWTSSCRGAGQGRGQAFLPQADEEEPNGAAVIVTDKLRSYGAAHREVMPSAEHRSHKGLNNRAENSHQPTRQRERAMKGFRSVGGALRFLSAFSGISPHFRPRRHLMTAAAHRAEMTVRFAIWDQNTGVAGLATTA